MQSEKQLKRKTRLDEPAITPKKVEKKKNDYKQHRSKWYIERGLPVPNIALKKKEHDREYHENVRKADPEAYKAYNREAFARKIKNNYWIRKRHYRRIAARKYAVIYDPDNVKTCTRCGKERHLKAFDKVKDKRYLEGFYYRSECFMCRRQMNRVYYVNNKEKFGVKDVT